MKNITKRKALTLLSVGIFIIAASQVFSHYLQLIDLTKGTFTGIGIGLLLTALGFGSFKNIRGYK
ncbi:hypothetical protein [Algibacter pacificus]|uniref:hypothetical protein n=1 Tax=Algibacter pacificus TaxID=2599389 RepID=UPI0011C882C9|nr:hypothetical protein [Algibacter pacificus]